MPRGARLRLAGVAWHVIQREHNRPPCFYAKEDNRYYRETLGEQAMRWDCAVHAYVLMTNEIRAATNGNCVCGESRFQHEIFALVDPSRWRYYAHQRARRLVCR